MGRPSLALFLVGCLAVVAATFFWNTQSLRSNSTKGDSKNSGFAPAGSAACAVALAPHNGDGKIDAEIRRLQQEARSQSSVTMTRLGWAFITKARLSFDPGYYKLGEACALCARSRNSNDPDALLLQAHILQSLHKFKDAEPIVRTLTNIRNEAFDFALYGDVLMEQGRLTEAIPLYQRMIDLKPDLQSYTRVAHMRWLKGDLAGAIEVMRVAVTAGSPNDAEPTAWAYTHLGIYELQAGDRMAASRCAQEALQYAQNYPPALLLAGRVLLAQSKSEEAVRLLQSAAAATRLPEYEWTLADALREVGDVEKAAKVEAEIMLDGASSDPRTFSLYLATREQQIKRAYQLACDELDTRADVFTMDAIAWAARAGDKLVEARQYSKRALAEGTQDARLLYHAGCIALDAGDDAEAEQSLVLSSRIKQMLLPSERDDLEREFAVLKTKEKSASSASRN